MIDKKLKHKSFEIFRQMGNNKICRNFNSKIEARLEK